MVTPQTPFAHFASVDWAKQKHHAVILNPAGQIVATFDFNHTAAGYAPLAVAIETSQGTIIDQLLQTPDCTIYPLNPKAAQRYRERKGPRAAPRATTWMPGALPTRCAWIGPTGSRSASKIRCWNNCGCCAATRWL